MNMDTMAKRCMGYATALLWLAVLNLGVALLNLVLQRRWLAGLSLIVSGVCIAVRLWISRAVKRARERELELEREVQRWMSELQ